MIQYILVQLLNAPANAEFFKNNRLLGCVLVKYYLMNLQKKKSRTINKFYRLRYQLNHAPFRFADKRKLLIAPHSLIYGSPVTITTKQHTTPIEAVVMKNKECLILYTEETIPEDQITVYFWYQESGYSFKSYIIKREDNQVWIQYPAKVTWIRHRRYKRINITLPATFEIIDSNHINYRLDFNNPQNGQIKNISEGGLNMIVQQPVDVNRLLKIQFILENKPTVVCCQVKGVSHNTETNETSLNLMFVQSPPIEMFEPILSYIYGLTNA